MTTIEQWIQAQQWLKRNAIYIIAFFILVIAGTGGWKYWKKSQFEHKSAASDLYQQVMTQSIEGEFSEARSTLTKLEKSYIDTIYPFLGNLQLAKHAYLNDRVDIAKETLQWVIINAEDEIIIYTATDRLSRLYLNDKETQKVLDLINEALGKISNESSVASLNMLLGDTYLQQNNIELARSAYQVAKQNLPPNSTLKELIEMKIRDASSL